MLATKQGAQTQHTVLIRTLDVIFTGAQLVGHKHLKFSGTYSPVSHKPRVTKVTTK